MFKNLTPHSLTLHLPNGSDLVVPPFAAKGEEARVSSIPGSVVERDFGDVTFPVATPATVGPVVNLPPPEEGVVYLVSGFVGQHPDVAQGKRPDVLCPGTGPSDNAVRNDKGHVVAVTRLVSY